MAATAPAGDAGEWSYWRALPAASVALFWRFAEMARAGRPVTFELQDERIVLCGTRRIFSSARVREHGLEGHINLARRVTDRRIRKVDTLTKRLYFHRYHVDAISDL